RHTRFSRDWSSDVCSSDLGGDFNGAGFATADTGLAQPGANPVATGSGPGLPICPGGRTTRPANPVCALAGTAGRRLEHLAHTGATGSLSARPGRDPTADN